ncbi:4421_t:CDS:2, partial [Funneliformis geosporum]
NWEKSVLLTNRNDNNNAFTCIINGTPTVIPPLSLNESTRYLGVWISLGRNKTFTHKLDRI